VIELCRNVNRILISSTGIECCVPVTGGKVTANQKHDNTSFTLKQDKKKIGNLNYAWSRLTRSFHLEIRFAGWIV
jgi:hypothetical protein